MIIDLIMMFARNQCLKSALLSGRALLIVIFLATAVANADTARTREGTQVWLQETPLSYSIKEINKSPSS